MSTSKEESPTDASKVAKPVSAIFRFAIFLACCLAAFFAGKIFHYVTQVSSGMANSSSPDAIDKAKTKEGLVYQPRDAMDEAGFRTVYPKVARWPSNATSAEVGLSFDQAASRLLARLAQSTAGKSLSGAEQVAIGYYKTICLNFDGKSDEAYEVLSDCRNWIEKDPKQAADSLYSIIYLQGMVGLRKGETENCIMCRGESSCILPIASAAVHQNEMGSRLAIKHFTEYLQQFPDDMGVRWLLNVAYMTLGEYPHKVPAKFLVSLEHFKNDEAYAIGRFRDVGHKVGVNRLNLGGGGIMEDFDNDGLLDIFITSFDPTEHAALYLNSGRTKFVEATEQARLLNEKGGINCVQCDFDNDGDMDVLIIRGAWLLRDQAMPLSLLRNDGKGSFTNVTVESGLGAHINSIAAGWADYDNDGWMDVFVCSEYGPCRLYHNEQNGTFRDLAEVAGVGGSGTAPCKGVTWIDYNNDRFVDLFVNYMGGESAKFYVNNRNGTFTSKESELGIDGPKEGFACWSWDYDNDGWLDIFATSYDRTLADVIAGFTGKENRSASNRLFRNVEGKRFEDVTQEVGLNHCFSTMGSNFGDFDNDGFLDMYLGTGDPNYSMLVPNRMFRNLGGKKFAEITASSGTGNLQKGHGTACGDWDEDGNVDLFMQMGGAVNGDKYHNILFQNPGHENSWLTLKLVGTKTNRAAIGARIKVVTPTLTVYRTVTSGSSFGANPLRQTIGLGNAKRIDYVEIQWPVSGQTQVLNNIELGQLYTITEP